jgi:hypothetical protein
LGFFFFFISGRPKLGMPFLVQSLGLSLCDPLLVPFSDADMASRRDGCESLSLFSAFLLSFFALAESFPGLSSRAVAEVISPRASTPM